MASSFSDQIPTIIKYYTTIKAVKDFRYWERNFELLSILTKVNYLKCCNIFWIKI